jgi:hypothetical protein
VVLGTTPAADVVIPAGPNSWLFDSAGTCVPGAKITTNDRIKNWTDAARQIRLYFWLDTTGQIDLTLQAAVTGGESQIRCTLGKESKQISLTSATPTTIPVGTFTIDRAGYQYLELTGISKTATTFGDIDHLQLSGSAAAGKVHFLKEDFHFGRRGPSVHLNYRLPKEAQDICYFYNEITVPVGRDVIGTYAMANGFAEGYSGMQVNSTTERRILFSVWSPFSTDDPKQIPESDRIVLLAKGKDVKAQAFGGEGSGGQSYLVYPWKAGTTYRFLLRGEPSGDGTTVYTAYFYPPETGKWQLIASFRRPKTDTYLKRWHSFLENFAPDTGAITREAHYTNQWARDRNGRWFSVKEAGYTADATAHKQARLDYAGGVTADGQFFLRNAGFFSERVPYGASFTRTPAPQPPEIDLTHLPTE